MIIEKSPLMLQIKEHQKDYEKPSYDATINGEYIIPGINGKSVSVLESFYQMKKESIFNENLLVFNEIVPSKSISNNKTLIINKANSYKKKVSIIIDDNIEVKNYCEKNNINANILSNMKKHNNKSNLEIINNDLDYETYEKFLEKLGKTNELCYVSGYNKAWCQRKGKYLIESSYKVNNSSLISLNVTAGDILYIDNTLSLSAFKVLLQKIAYHDLGIMYLSKLISEK